MSNSIEQKRNRNMPYLFLRRLIFQLVLFLFVFLVCYFLYVSVCVCVQFIVLWFVFGENFFRSLKKEEEGLRGGKENIGWCFICLFEIRTKKNLGIFFVFWKNSWTAEVIISFKNLGTHFCVSSSVRIIKWQNNKKSSLCAAPDYTELNWSLGELFFLLFLFHFSSSA